MHRLCTPILLALTSTLLVLWPVAADGATWEPNVRIAYAYQGDIYVAHPSGTPAVNITSTVPGAAWGPSLSRTGRYVSYKVDLENWVYDFQTGTHSRISSGGSARDFSPTADQMVFSEYTLADHRFNLYTSGVDGTSVVNRTNETTESTNLNPTWGADGESLLYTRDHGARTCRVDRGGYDEIYHADRLHRLSFTGGTTQLVGDDDTIVLSGAEGGGVLAWVKSELPPGGSDGYCAYEPSLESSLVVDGVVVGSASPLTPSVNDAGDVAYTSGNNVMVDPAGAEGPSVLFQGSDPDWGVAYGQDPTECTIEGGDGDDTLHGTSGPDVICGHDGDDVIFGLDGDDVILGGAGEDQLIGGPGDDTLDGGDDNDVLRGDTGDDALEGGQGIDLITYFTSRRRLVADLRTGKAVSKDHGSDTVSGVESVFGSKTADVITGDGHSNALYGGPGKDVVAGLGGTDFLRGNAGNDTLRGGNGADLLEDVEGNDYLDGGSSKDTCYDDHGKRDRRRSCEKVDKKDPKKTKGPTGGPGEGEVNPRTHPVPAMVLRRGSASYWYLGNSDYLFVYSRATTAQIGSLASTGGWESQACRIVRLTPARGACSAVGALNAVQKYQMQWFLWNAKRNGGCAIGILDWGRHGVFQFKKRWKVRAAQSARYNVAIPWVTSGRFSDVKTKGGSVRVSCS